MALPLEQLLVWLIVAGALAYSARQLVPASAWRALASVMRGRVVEQPATAARQPHPGCHGCPASNDCGKRR